MKKRGGVLIVFGPGAFSGPMWGTVARSLPLGGKLGDVGRYKSFR